MEERPQSFGDRIHALREARGWTLREAAKHLGLAWSRIGHYERGGASQLKPPVPPYRTVIRMARVYQVPEAELLRLAGYAASLDLDDDELALVHAFRSLPPADRAAELSRLQEIAARATPSGGAG